MGGRVCVLGWVPVCDSVCVRARTRARVYVRVHVL